jgi:hypothetical protein
MGLEANALRVDRCKALRRERKGARLMDTTFTRAADTTPDPGSSGFDAWVRDEAARMRQGDLDAATLHSMTNPVPFYCSPRGGCLCGCVACRDGWDDMVCICLTAADLLGHGGRVAALYAAPITVRDLEHVGSVAEIESIVNEAVELHGFGRFEGAQADAEYENADRHQAAVDAALAWRDTPRRGLASVRSGA